LLRMSVSVGAATFPEDAEEARELVSKADQAMYRDKAGCRRLGAEADMPQARLV
jgi:GGDEF domain-containing protein